MDWFLIGDGELILIGAIKKNLNICIYYRLKGTLFPSVEAAQVVKQEDEEENEVEEKNPEDKKKKKGKKKVGFRDQKVFA